MEGAAPSSAERDARPARTAALRAGRSGRLSLAVGERVRLAEIRLRWQAQPPSDTEPGQRRGSPLVGLGSWLRALADRWRRSLQLRVVTATLVLSGVVVAVLGIFLMQQIAQNLIAGKERSDQSIAQEGQSFAQTEPGVNAYPGPAARALMPRIVTDLQATGGSSGGDYAVAVGLPDIYQDSVYSPGAVAGFPTTWSIDSMPRSLVRDVTSAQQRGSTRMWVVSASMALAGSRRPVPGLAFGAPFGHGYQIYYFFPLTSEQQSLAQVQRTLLLVGIAVVFLLAAIAWLVTRWVAVPVRQAAASALRLSTGNLTERLQVRGTDELAALGTSFNQMAASLQEKMSELEELSQVQRQFVSDVSHELRTPLTTIRIAADVLFATREQLDASAARSAELLQGQLERFESLLTDLLEISRYDANVATLDAEAADVCDLVRSAADVAQQLAERRGARIEFRLPAEPCIAEVDRRRVERILRNLLINAVEHGEGRDCVVTVAADSAAVAVSVRDFGVGLAPGEAQQVFDRFWRADPARARTSGGTGLGLSIALEDARLHNGWLHAWGEPGRGSVFRLTLPRAAGSELAGSPLPLGPDEAELAAEAVVLGDRGVVRAGENGAGDRHAASTPGEPGESPARAGTSSEVPTHG